MFATEFNLFDAAIQGARGIGAGFFNQKTNKIANKLQELQQ
jgi:hypothetical protein